MNMQCSMVAVTNLRSHTVQVYKASVHIYESTYGLDKPQTTKSKVYKNKIQKKDKVKR